MRYMLVHNFDHLAGDALDEVLGHGPDRGGAAHRRDAFHQNSKDKTCQGLDSEYCNLLEALPEHSHLVSHSSSIYFS